MDDKSQRRGEPDGILSVDECAKHNSHFDGYRDGTDEQFHYMNGYRRACKNDPRAAPQPAEPVTLECPKCGVDRAKEPCAGNLMDCEFKGVAHAADPVKVDAKASVPSDEDIFNELQAHGALTTINTVNAVRALLARYGQPASGHSAAPMDTTPGHSGQPAASAEPLLSALLGMQRFFGKWPEFVPAPEYIGAAYDAVKRMNSVLSAAPVAEQPAVSVEPGCGCEACQPNTWGNVRMIVCAICGNKRCPHATDHRHACTGSNEPGQKGSSYEHCTAPVAAQPSVPEGWKLVPVEPTSAMFDAGAGRGGLGMDYHEWMGRISSAWPAMLAAVPTPSADGLATRREETAQRIGSALGLEPSGNSGELGSQAQQDAPTPEEEEAWRKLEKKL